MQVKAVGKEHLRVEGDSERCELAPVRAARSILSVAKVRPAEHIYNIIYILYIILTLTGSAHGGFATPEAFRSLRSLHPLDSRKTIAKRKGKAKKPPFFYYIFIYIIYIIYIIHIIYIIQDARPVTPYIQYRILCIHTREPAYTSL